MKIKLKAAILAGILGFAPVLGENPAEAAGFFTVGSMYEHYNATGWRQGLFTSGACDALGYTFNPKAMYVDGGVANWGHILSSLYLTGNGGCDSVRVYQRTQPSVYWNCLRCGGRVVNLYAPFNDDVGLIRVFRTTSIVP